MGLESKCQGHVSDDPGDYWRRSCPPPGSLAVMELCVQEETFHHCCQLLLQQSEQLRDGWSWESVQGSQVGYLRKTALRSVDINSSSVWDQVGSSSDSGSHTVCHQQQQEKSALVASFDADNIEEDIADDDGGVCSVSKDSREVLQYEYHILYSCSYSTPVLYFRAFTLEGRSLSLEEVWSSVHPNFRIRLQNSPLNTITQQEHPLLGQPFFMLHPCKTEEFMKPVLQLAQDQHRPVNYVLTWLSVVGPLVGLDVPLMYFTLLLPSPALLSNNKPN
ncbi:ubiquitin-like-conjugating enzyme ATG10 isoform X2 [Hippoglossus hippoglossus]|uniref:ubiquitin-like-conjugating enzyme ATG10 isoform X2 n=2 Tax=Hippoglossus TaxID=8266 RepID=UPI00148E638D|nr:ubiquitin-like-conjugating enzyme ATG10 isoform X2 [Hippoglossus hippoglossus]